MLLLAAGLMVGCEGQNEPTNEGGGSVESTDVASVSKVTNFYGTIYEVIMKDGNRMYFGIKNDKEVRMGCWSYFYDGSEYEYEKYAAYEYKGHLVIPEKITLEGKEYLVTELYNMSASSYSLSNMEITRLERPNTTLLSVVIPKTINKMKDGCFSFCTALKSVTFVNDSPIRELSNTFVGCASLKEVILPPNLSSVGANRGETFALCTSLNTINLPEIVTKIGENAFYGCTALENINLENVKTIESSAFSECTALKNLNMNNVENINTSAFYKCTSLETVTLENLEALGANTFDSCTSLISVVANKLEFLDTYTFIDCINLKKIDFPEMRKVMTGSFHNCTSLEEVKLDNLEALGERAFCGCTKLKKIELPRIKYLGITVEEEEDEIQWDGSDAFVGCNSLETVVLGNSLMYTDEHYLFEGCNSLKDVYCYATNPPMYRYDSDWDIRQFIGDFVLHVPASSIEAYQETAWGEISQSHNGGTDYVGERTIVAIEE